MNTTSYAPSNYRFQALLELPLCRMQFPLDIALAIFFILILCTSPVYAATDQHPLERVNRITHTFNHAVDTVLVKPLAKTYERLALRVAKTGVRNLSSKLPVDCKQRDLSNSAKVYLLVCP